MLQWIIANIICDQFEKQVKRNEQADRFTSMNIKFGLRIDYGNEQGYRHLHLRLIGQGYTTVLIKEDWRLNTKGNGSTGWIFKGCHDSCWRDAVQSIISEYADQLNTIDYVFKGWCHIEKLSQEAIDEIKQLEKKARPWLH